MFLLSSCSWLYPVDWNQVLRVENEDVIGTAPIGDAPTTSEWSAILLPAKVRLMLEVWQYPKIDTAAHPQLVVYFL